MENIDTKGRFAPSPSGRMHVGNLFSSLLAWLSAKRAGGKLVLRMEDLDSERCPKRFSRLLADDLEWLGLTWDEGYRAGGQDGPYEQSDRGECYAAALRALEELGVVYPCYCSRAERLAASAPHRSDGQNAYDGKCRALTAAERAALEQGGRRAAMRMAVPERVISFTDGHMGPMSENLAYGYGDFIVRRSDGVFAYQLAVVVDDAAMGVTQVVRGSDLLSSTPRQLWLYELLGLTPPEFFHLPLLLASDGRRLSKREGDLGMDTLRERFTPEEVIGKLAFLAGLRPTAAPVTAAALVADFSWAKVPLADIYVPDHLWGGA